MPISASAKKSLRVSERKRLFNDRRRKTMRLIIKDISDLVKEGKISEAKNLLPNAYKAIDKAEKRGVLKPNTASRKKSLLSRTTKEVK
ncbi:MAG: small subunit ribosomal protein S20 [Candidatus Paceibacteria bacterium]|jgi:small subunit ribosomal protein S20